ncbi:hypothetical protein [Streptomyces malaysiensis]
MPAGWPGPQPEPAAERAPEAAPEPVSASVPEPVLATEPVDAPVPEPPGPADPAPLGVDRTPTGVPEVDARLGRLADADHLATSGHLEVYEDVHRGLRDTLTALDRRPGPPPPGPRPPSAA